MKIKLLYVAPLLIAINANAADKQFPVLWSDSFTSFYGVSPKTVKDFDSFYDKKWAHSSVVVRYKSKGVVKKKKISSCSELHTVKNKIISIDEKEFGDWSLVNSWRVSCDAMKRISKMKPASQIFIDEELADIIKKLPEVHNETNSMNIKIFFDSIKSAVVSCSKTDVCRVKANEFSGIVFIDAEGDFNGDGIQDILVTGNIGVRNGGGDRSFGLVVTKSCKTCPLTYLDWWEGDSDLNK
jgi:hypothetical protein